MELCSFKLGFWSRYCFYRIENDKVEAYSITQSFNKPENWTKALKYTLCNLKWALYWFVGNTSFQPLSTSSQADVPAAGTSYVKRSNNSKSDSRNPTGQWFYRLRFSTRLYIQMNFCLCSWSLPVYFFCTAFEFRISYFKWILNVFFSYQHTRLIPTPNIIYEFLKKIY